MCSTCCPAFHLSLASLLDPLIERFKDPASTAAITSIAASSSLRYPRFPCVRRRDPLIDQQSRIIATVRPMSIFSCSVEQFRDARTESRRGFRMSDVFCAFAPSFCYALLAYESRAAYSASGAISTPFGQASVPASIKNSLKASALERFEHRALEPLRNIDSPLSQFHHQRAEQSFRLY